MNKQDAKNEHEETHIHQSGRALLPAANALLESCYLANSNVKKVLLHRRFWMGKVKRSNKILPQILSPSQRKVRCNSTFSKAMPPLTITPAFFFFPLNVILSLILQASKSRCVEGSSLSLRTTLKTQIHQAQRNWRLPRELLTAQCKATHEDTVNSLPWMQHKKLPCAEKSQQRWLQECLKKLIRDLNELPRF